MQIHNIRYFQEQLMNWYTLFRRSLPWRKTSDPYHIWVSEVMLQQTQVKTVIPYYQRFVLHFPDVCLLSKADLENVLKHWEGLGYYARAHNLHKTAGIVVKKHNHIFPNDIKLLRELPGIGEYIASAVLSIAYGQAYAVVDGNVKRVLARLFKIDIPVNRSISGKIFKEYAERILEKKDPGNFNQAMMELGALVCTPKKPNCPSCPVKIFCQAFKSHMIEQYPKRENTPKTPQFHIATGVVCKGQRILITRRKPKGLLGGLWEFPGGKIKEGEEAEIACAREIKEEVNLKVKAYKHIIRIKHAYTHFKIVMDVYLCSYLAGRIRLNGPIDYRWIRPDEIDDFPFPGANHKFIPILKEHFKKSLQSDKN